jgi:hypothetical protein
MGKMKIDFTKKQYETLLKLVYLGNWMINAIRTDDRVKKYEEFEQHIFSFAEEFGLEKYIEFDEESGQFFPTNELEFGTDIEKYRQEYDDNNFWEDLHYRLVERDFVRKYSRAAIEKMDYEERIEKDHEFHEKYGKELEEHGIERLEIRE